MSPVSHQTPFVARLFWVFLSLNLFLSDSCVIVAPRTACLNVLVVSDAWGTCVFFHLIALGVTHLPITLYPLSRDLAVCVTLSSVSLAGGDPGKYSLVDDFMSVTLLPWARLLTSPNFRALLCHPSSPSWKTLIECNWLFYLLKKMTWFHILCFY